MQPDELLDGLRELRRATDHRLRDEWGRSLGFADAVFDRWERARGLGFGAEASIYDSALVYGDVEVGAHAWIGPYVLLDGSGGPLHIGDWCAISAGVHIYTHDTVRRTLSLGAAPVDTGPVSVGEGTQIGSQSVIAPGVTIGDRSVVGANSFVNRDVASRTVVAGSPARAVGTVVGEGADVSIDVLSVDGEFPVAP